MKLSINGIQTPVLHFRNAHSFLSYNVEAMLVTLALTFLLAAQISERKPHEK